MCLSTVYTNKAPAGEPLCKNIAKVENLPGEIIFTDIMGRKIKVRGVISSIDLMDNTIKVRED